MNKNLSPCKIVGIAGASGSGKSFFARALQDQLPVSNFILSQDNYYKDRSDISLLERQNINYDHPDAIDFDLLVRHLQALKSGGAIEQPHYDFSVHNRIAQTTHVEPTSVVLLDGILIYAVQTCRDIIDYKVYIDTPLDICFIRRLQRDIRERGRSVQSVVEQYMRSVRPMYLQFVKPTMQDANLVAKGLGDMQNDVAFVIRNILE
jgi:uridine kinase